MDDQVGWYLRQAGRIPLLTAAEEIELGHTIQKWQKIKDQPNPDALICRRGKKAYDRMLTANLRLVVDIARKYLKVARHMEFSDLISEGNLGLSRAVEKFDPERGYKFSTYAYWWIRQAVRRALSTQERVIRLPINAIEIQAKVSRYISEFKKEHGRHPTVLECSEWCEVRPHTMRAYLEHSLHPTSLDRQHDEARRGAPTYKDLIPAQDPDPSEQIEIDNGLERLESYLDMLRPNEAIVIKHRYGLENENPKTFSDIGRIMNISRERVRQLERVALKKMRLKMMKRADLDLAD